MGIFHDQRFRNLVAVLAAALIITLGLSVVEARWPVDQDFGPPHRGRGVFWKIEGEGPCAPSVYRSNPARNDLRWQVGSADGPSVVLPWTNLAGYDQSEQRMLLATGETGNIKMGGTQLLYPQGCEAAAKEKLENSGAYEKDGVTIPRDQVTLNDLTQMGLVNS